MLRTLSEIVVQQFPEKYFDVPIKRKPKAPVNVLQLMFTLETIACAGVFAGFYSYFSSTFTNITTISGTIIPGQTCEVLIPKSGLSYFSKETSENGQFSKSSMKISECMNLLEEKNVCSEENVFGFISLSGIINPNNSQYYSDGFYSFTPTEAVGLKTSTGVLYNPSISFPNPPVQEIVFNGDSKLFYYWNIESGNYDSCESFDYSRLLIDYECLSPQTICPPLFVAFQIRFLHSTFLRLKQL
jgi:hypothetical protein